MEEDIFNNYGVEVTIDDPEDFLVIKETLTRIGIAATKNKKLYQSVHLLHKRGRYAIIHFKEMFALDGKPTDFTDQDRGRRNMICTLLEQWKLVKVLNSEQIKDPVVPMSTIKIIPFKEKGDWQLIAKYNIGKKKQ